MERNNEHDLKDLYTVATGDRAHTHTRTQCEFKDKEGFNRYALIAKACRKTCFYCRGSLSKAPTVPSNSSKGESVNDMNVITTRLRALAYALCLLHITSFYCT